MTKINGMTIHLDCDHTAILKKNEVENVRDRTRFAYVRNERLMLARPIAPFPKTLTKSEILRFQGVEIGIPGCTCIMLGNLQVCHTKE